MLEIRKARPEDAEAIARIHADSWREAYSGIVPEELLRTRYSFGPRLKMWRKFLSEDAGGHFVCEADGKPVGFFSLCAPRDRDMPGDALELGAIYFSPGCRGKGYGSEAMRFIVREAQRRGCRKLCLWVLRQNAAVIRFYEKSGFRYGGLTRVLELGGPVPECRYERELKDL